MVAYMFIPSMVGGWVEGGGGGDVPIVWVTFFVKAVDAEATTQSSWYTCWWWSHCGASVWDRVDARLGLGCQPCAYGVTRSLDRSTCPPVWIFVAAVSLIWVGVAFEFANSFPCSTWALGVLGRPRIHIEAARSKTFLQIVGMSPLELALISHGQGQVPVGTFPSWIEGSWKPRLEKCRIEMSRDVDCNKFFLDHIEYATGNKHINFGGLMRE
jgi:hypothetical protein